MHFEAQFAALPTFDPDDHALLTVVETAKGSRNKLSYNLAFCAFELRKVLPVGMIFPYDFGFVPGTRGDDGDPLDVLLLLDDPVPMGSVVRARAVGAIEAEQREENSHWIRNDRLIAVATHAQLHGNIKKLKELNIGILNEIEAFFQQYNALENREFRTLGQCGPKSALKLIKAAQKRQSQFA